MADKAFIKDRLEALFDLGEIFRSHITIDLRCDGLIERFLVTLAELCLVLKDATLSLEASLDLLEGYSLVYDGYLAHFLVPLTDLELFSTLVRMAQLRGLDMNVISHDH